MVILHYGADRNDRHPESRALADSGQSRKSIVHAFSGVDGENTCDVAQAKSNKHITETNQANGV